MTYERRRAAVLAALVHEDPMELDGPGNDLSDEYDAEAREIARRLVHAGESGDRDSVVAVIDEVFVASFGSGVPRARADRIAAAVSLGETSG